MWKACNYYWWKTNMQIESVTVPAKHQITQIKKMELNFNWMWNSKQKNHITWYKSHNAKLTYFKTFSILKNYNTKPNLTIIEIIIKRMRYFPYACCPWGTQLPLKFRVPPKVTKFLSSPFSNQSKISRSPL